MGIRTILFVFIFSTSITSIFSQSGITEEDTLRFVSDEVKIQAIRENIRPLQKLKEVHGTFIISGRKSEVIEMHTIAGNITEKTGRQIFSKIPGVFVYDMDGSGNQMNISTRGLDPHRTWEYNIRQNNIITNTDLYAYPASHYNAPMESYSRIELIRGTAGLQYGSQFGGMINYVTKSAPVDREFSMENISSVGSNGLFSNYTSAGGTIGKFSYYTYNFNRQSEGYRANGRSRANNQFVSLGYRFSEKFNLKTEFARSIYIYQIPGPLTDSMFAENLRQSTRSRNHYSPEIYVPSITAEWTPDDKTLVTLTSSAIIGQRSIVQFVGFANRPDIINPATNQYANRQVDIDRYKSYYTELRVRRNYHLGSLQNVLSAGFTYTNNNTHRRQQGKGTTGSDYDLSVEGPFGRDLNFKTQNIAAFVENMIKITPSWSVTPGFRVENGVSTMTGTTRNINYPLLTEINHQFPLFGVNSEWKINENNRIYGGFSQAFRPVIFQDIIPPDSLNITDPNLKNATGYNAEIGISGSLSNRLYYDITAFTLRYDNRIGTQLITEGARSYLYKTNTGVTQTNGLEIYAEYVLHRNLDTKVAIHTSTSYFSGRYIKGNLVINGENKSIEGNRPEGLPEIITRNGLSIRYKAFTTTLLYSYVSETFADPANTVVPSPTGAVGLVPGYGLLDLNFIITVSKNIVIRTGANNLLDKQYFTKRPTIYPGGGIWPSDGRTLNLMVALSI